MCRHAEGNSGMVAGIRTRDLRKTYTSAPPVGAGTGGFSFGAPKAKGKQAKPEVVALDGISLDISPGEIFCLLGPNGAGKSTTVGVLTTRVRPTGGQAFIGEYDVWKAQVAVKRLIGVVAQRPNLDFSLTARDSRFPRRLFRPRFSGAQQARRDPSRSLQAPRPRRPDGSRILRRHDARSASPLPRRAQRRPGPADPSAPVENRPRVQRQR